MRYSPSTFEPGRHVLLQQRAGVRVLQVGRRRRRDDGATGDVVQVADHQAVRRRAGVLAGVGVQLVGERRAERAGVGVLQRGLQAGPHDGRLDDHLGDLLLDVRLAGEAVGLGDELGQADEQVAAVGHAVQAAEALPQAERVGEHRRLGDLAVEEDPLVRDEHVVEHHEPLRVVVGAGDREVADVLVARRVRRVDDLHAGRVDRDHRRDGVVVLAVLHRLGRDGQQLVAHRRTGDVQLGAADDDAVGLTVDHVHVGVGVLLLAAAGASGCPWRR